MNSSQIKKTLLVLFGLSLFFLPGQNFYLTAQASWQPSLVQEVDLDLTAPTAYPVNFTGREPPFLTAYSVLVLDRDSAVALYQKNARAKLLPASTVKIMTALVSLDHYQLEDVLTVNGVSWEGQDIGLEEGERLSVRALLYGLLVASANDAAQVLAKNYPGGEEAFVIEMNEKAEELNLRDTYFADPTGLSEGSYTTTLDLAHLTSQALQNPVFSQMVATSQIVISDLSGQITHPLANINELLGQISGMKGVKTGWTEEAGECLVSLVEREGRGIIVVVLRSGDRFGETAQLVAWAFANHSWEAIAPPIQD